MWSCHGDVLRQGSVEGFKEPERTTDIRDMKLNGQVVAVGALIGSSVLGIAAFVGVEKSPEEIYMEECRAYGETDPVLQAFAEGAHLVGMSDGLEITCSGAWLGYSDDLCADRHSKFDVCLDDGKTFYVDPETQELKQRE